MKLGLIILAVLLALPLLPSAPVFASPGLKVSPLILSVSIAPGESETHTITVSNDSATPMDIVVEVKGLGQSPDGSFQVLAPDEDKSPYSARNFISISPPEFHLEPGSFQEVEVIIDVPEDVGSGGRYAMIYTRTKPDGEGVGIATAIATCVVIRVEGTELTKTGSITDVIIPEVSGQPLEIVAVFENTGNFHYKAQADAILRDHAGNELGSASTPLTQSSIVPGYVREFRFSLTPAGELLPGTYLDLRVYLEDGTMLDRWTKELGRGFALLDWASGLLANPWSKIIGAFAGGGILAGLLVYFLMRRGLDTVATTTESKGATDEKTENTDEKTEN